MMTNVAYHLSFMDHQNNPYLAVGFYTERSILKHCLVTRAHNRMAEVNPACCGWVSVRRDAAPCRKSRVTTTSEGTVPPAGGLAVLLLKT